MSGDKDALAALNKLSGIASGGHPRAQELVNLIDNAVLTGELSLPTAFNSQKPPSKLKEAVFILIHPLTTVRTKIRQIMVGCELELPPHTSTIEDFPDLPISQAAKAIENARRQPIGSGVPRDAWSLQDQERMLRGKLPKDYPEHPNV